MNNVALIGRLVADPELRRTQSGLSVTSFRIAVNRRFAKQGDEVTADFIDIVAWRQTAEFICNYFSKGRAIGVLGAIQTRSYTDKDGNKRTAVEVVADSVYFADGGKSGNKMTSADDLPKYSPPQGDYEEVTEDDDLPF